MFALKLPGREELVASSASGIFRPLPKGALFRFVHIVVFLLFLIHKNFVLQLYEHKSIGTIGGAHNFCMQKLDCRLAGLVYFVFTFL